MLCGFYYDIQYKRVNRFLLLSKLFEINVFLLSPEKSINSIKLPCRETLILIQYNLTQTESGWAEESGEASGQRLYRTTRPASHTAGSPGLAAGRSRLSPCSPSPGLWSRFHCLGCWVQATCLLCIPFPQVREQGVHSVIIHLKVKQESVRQT